MRGVKELGGRKDFRERPHSRIVKKPLGHDFPHDREEKVAESRMNTYNRMIRQVSRIRRENKSIQKLVQIFRLPKRILGVITLNPPHYVGDHQAKKGPAAR